MKFNVTTASEAATCITGFNNKVTVNFSENTLTNGQERNGVITLPAGNGEKWAILLPQEASEEGLAYSEDVDYTGTRGAVPAVYENGYFTVGIVVNVTTEVNPGEVPVGAISGKFTINASGGKVYFSKGNLQYNKTTQIWSFMEHQYDMVETDWQYVGENYANQNIVSLFGWGTSGWNNGNMYYQPYNTGSNYDPNTGYGYGPTDGTNYGYNLTGTYANADWGVYNAISNGGNLTNLWRTLTREEWSYVLSSRTTPSGIRYAKGSVNGVTGVILLPDSWSASIYALNYANTSAASFSVNTVTLEDWETMEANGAVFLPAAGVRGETVGYVGHTGYYWSASCNDSNHAWSVSFGDTYPYTDNNDRYYGFSVRLVCPAQ